MDKFIIAQKDYTIDEIYNARNAVLSIDDGTKNRVQYGRDFLDKKLAESKEPIYGINTGFGSLCNTSINPEMLAELQVNLVRSHACGAGKPISKRISKLIFLLKIIGLSKGNSGISLDLLEHMVAVYNAGAIPVIYEFGSLGASGDLAPLAHLAMVLIGEGEVWHGEEKIPGADWYKQQDVSPIALKAKEGISLLNGTQFMSAFGVDALYHVQQLMRLAHVTTAASMEAFSARLAPFKDELHAVRRNEGQRAVAKEIRALLQDSKLQQEVKRFVQDPYSFRCVPQVHGASYTALQHVQSVVENEINAVTDNPTLLFEDDSIVSGGNFHGQPLALSYEYACMATAELGSISERRIYKLLSGERGLPAFLVESPGINSGFMIPQYTAASLVNRNKQLCTPSVVDTIDSSNGQEDHVSMGANVATKWHQVVQNVHEILATELLVGFQALDFLDASQTSTVLYAIYKDFRKEIPFVTKDAFLHEWMQKSLKFTRVHFDLYL